MADTLHLKLANTIKNVHQTLREEARKIGEERAWAQHCKQTEILQTYAQAMQLLATEYWEKNASDSNNIRAICRVQWVAQECENYYFRGGVVDGFKKEIALCQRFQIDTEELLEQESEVLKSLESIRVLDVGSCYNPFRKFPRFDVVAVDIAPASSDVQKCDFLNLEILNEGIVPESSNEVLTELPSAYFDVVIFSLLLEYFPSCKQRYICCSKASKLLSPGGILCIVTPDSKHATANSVMMKKWRYALANEGFLRIQYSKLPHLHCMVYRKSIHSSLSKLWLSSAIATDKERGKGFSEGLDELIIIPQDSRPSTDSVINIDPNVRDSNETIASIFANLPAVS